VVACLGRPAQTIEQGERSAWAMLRGDKILAGFAETDVDFPLRASTILQTLPGERTMNIAYVSLDAVHEDLARSAVQATGWRLEAYWPTETIEPQRFPVVIYDLDYLPIQDRQRVLEHLMSWPVSGVVAVHGYDLTKQQASTLREKGIVVSRRFGARLLSRVFDRTARS
jgi:hypothetical protein